MEKARWTAAESESEEAVAVPFFLGMTGGAAAAVEFFVGEGAEVAEVVAFMLGGAETVDWPSAAVPGMVSAVLWPLAMRLALISDAGRGGCDLGNVWAEVLEFMLPPLVVIIIGAGEPALCMEGSLAREPISPVWLLHSDPFFAIWPAGFHDCPSAFPPAGAASAP